MQHQSLLDACCIHNSDIEAFKKQQPCSWQESFCSEKKGNLFCFLCIPLQPPKMIKKTKICYSIVSSLAALKKTLVKNFLIKSLMWGASILQLMINYDCDPLLTLRSLRKALWYILTNLKAMKRGSFFKKTIFEFTFFFYICCLINHFPFSVHVACSVFILLPLSLRIKCCILFSTNPFFFYFYSLVLSFSFSAPPCNMYASSWCYISVTLNLFLPIDLYLCLLVYLLFLGLQLALHYLFLFGFHPIIHPTN